jgi:hypothetical protein
MEASMAKKKKKFYIMRCNVCGLKVPYSWFMTLMTQLCPKENCCGKMQDTGHVVWLSDED